MVKKLSLIVVLLMVTTNIFGGDLFTTAYTIYKEAGGESLTGKHAVASVIYNRSVKSGKSFEYECLKRKQFSCWNDVINKNRPPLNLHNQAERKAWDESYCIAYVMVYGSFTPYKYLNQFYNPSLCSPSWGDKMTNVRYIGGHKFGKL
jgi:spore germination cell wall hydrolase CwlJ-like protein